MKQHRLVMGVNVLRADLLSPMTHRGLYQLTHVHDARGALKHDDMVDVLSMGARHWSEYLNADSRKAEEERIRKTEEENERRFFEGTAVFAWTKPPRGLQGKRGRGRPVSRRSR